MSNWRSLVEVYSEWRWKLYRKAQRNEKFMEQVKQKGRFRLYCNSVDTRMDFSAYAGLPRTISIEDMRKLEKNFQNNG